MATTEWTADDLARINKAIASGALRVEYNDRTVVYRSMNELLKAREVIKRNLGQVKRGSRILAEPGKGIC